MKKIRTIVLTGIFIMALAFFGAVPQTAQFMPDAAKADQVSAETEYTIFIYSGKEGYFGSKDTTEKKIKAKYDEWVTVSLDDLNLKVKDGKKYYVRGLKIAGHDNDQLSTVQMQSYTFQVKEDTSFSVAYGIAGGMVKYRVNYQDGSGNALHESEEFYGMAGDKPVVAFKHIDGYIPDDYNLTKTLSGNENSNEFTFTYHRGYAPSGTEGEEEVEGEGEGEGGDNNGNGAGNAAGNGTLTAGNANANNLPGTTIRDLDDNATPKAATTIEDEKTPGGILSGANALVAGIVGAGILIALALLYFLLKKRRDEEEEAFEGDDLDE